MAMADKNLDDALEHLQKLVLTVFIVYSVWCIALPRSLSLMEEDAMARDVATWLGFKEFASKLPLGHELNRSSLLPGALDSPNCDLNGQWPTHPSFECRYSGIGIYENGKWLSQR